MGSGAVDTPPADRVDLPSPGCGGTARHIARASRCGGQALVEGLVVVAAMAALFVAIPWLGRLQDLALQAAHASRYAAFSLARDPDLRPAESIRRHYFFGSSHQWRSLAGQRLVAQDWQARLAVAPHTVPATALPGGVDSDASALRGGLALDQWGILEARVQVSFPESPAFPPSTVEAGRHFARWRYPSLSRHTAILVDAGHAASDQLAQQRVAESGPGWGNAAAVSYSLGRRISNAVAPSDRGWGRDAPTFDWLAPWAGWLPSHHLAAWGENP